MKIDTYAERLKIINNCINQKATGSPKEFATKLGIGVSTLKLYIKHIKDKGIEVFFDRNRNTYYYANDEKIRFECGFIKADNNPASD